MRTLLELKGVRTNLDQLLTYKAEGALRFSKQKYYEMGNRASHLLTFQLCKAQASWVIPKILHPTTKVMLSQKGLRMHLQHSIRNYLKRMDQILKRTKSRPSFLSRLNVPSLTEEEASTLITEIRENEIRA